MRGPERESPGLVRPGRRTEERGVCRGVGGWPFRSQIRSMGPGPAGPPRSIAKGGRDRDVERRHDRRRRIVHLRLDPDRQSGILAPWSTARAGVFGALVCSTAPAGGLAGALSCSIVGAGAGEILIGSTAEAAGVASFG